MHSRNFAQRVNSLFLKNRLLHQGRNSGRCNNNRESETERQGPQKKNLFFLQKIDTNQN